MVKNNLVFGLAALIAAVGAMAFAMPEEIVRFIPASAPLFAVASKDAEKVSVYKILYLALRNISKRWTSAD